MREANKDIIRLEHIVQAIERIKRYTLRVLFPIYSLIILLFCFKSNFDGI